MGKEFKENYATKLRGKKMFIFLKMLIAIVIGTIVAVITLPFMLGFILKFLLLGAIGKSIFTIMWNSLVIGSIATILWGWE